MNKLQKIFYSLGYFEWLLVFVILLIGSLIIKINGDLSIIALVMLCAVCVILLIIFGHSNNFSFYKDKLFKYKIKYRVININIKGETYYIPVAQFISQWGYLYEFIIIRFMTYRYNTSCDIDSYSLDFRLEKLKEDPTKTLESGIKGFLWHKKKEDALYAIKCYKQKVEEKLKETDSISFDSTSINFEG